MENRHFHLPLAAALLQYIYSFCSPEWHVLTLSCKLIHTFVILISESRLAYDTPDWFPCGSASSFEVRLTVEIHDAES
jgi:hypothetical protein